jgi:UPF0755 protein
LIIISRILKIFAILIALLLFAVSGAVGVLIYYNQPPKTDDNFNIDNIDGITRGNDGSFYIEVRRGESSQSVGRRLEGARLIKNRLFWNLLCRYDKEPVKTGTYRLEAPASQIVIHRLLISGRQILHRVTIPEGVTLSKAAKIFEEAGICPADAFMEASKDTEIISHYNIPNDSMEGYLFPDTYLFPAEYPASQVVKTMADTFFTRINEIDPSVVTMSPADLNKKVILASIVEREYRVNEEAPVMAGVFENRIRIGMSLQSCATVEYIITEIQGKPHPKVLYNRDIEIQHPYNTYVVRGLPPGPISAPGAVALRAVFFPEKTEYLYFRLTNPQSGRHYFSKTFDEHISAGQLVPKGGF